MPIPRRGVLLAFAIVCASTPATDADVLASLATDRSWIGYTPTNYNPNFGVNPSEASMRADLQQLYDAGWRNLYNYTLDGPLQNIPRIAKEVGFEQVLAGVFYFDDAQLAREQANSVVQDQYIDGYLVGNEGLAFGRYGPEQLLGALEFFAGYGKPYTTTEVGGLYLGAPELADAGDFVTVNIQPWFNPSLDPTDPVAMARAVRDEYVAIKALRPDRLVVIKEAWWPTDALPYDSVVPPPGAASEANQIAFYEALANETDANGDPVLFMWGESHDQPWKNNEFSPFGLIGPDWGFYEADRTPKALVEALDDVYTASYPINSLAGDYDRNGVVNEADYAVWQESYGTTPDIAGAGADGNLDRVIDAADFTIWRDAFAAGATATPEPAAVVLLALGAGISGFRRR